MGGDLGGTKGTVPKTFELGAAHASVPPIFREAVFWMRNNVRTD